VTRPPFDEARLAAFRGHVDGREPPLGTQRRGASDCVVTLRCVWAAESNNVRQTLAIDEWPSRRATTAEVPETVSLRRLVRHRHPVTPRQRLAPSAAIVLLTRRGKCPSSPLDGQMNAHCGLTADILSKTNEDQHSRPLSASNVLFEVIGVIHPGRDTSRFNDRREELTDNSDVFSKTSHE
jgi:hypothetical protein